MRHDAKTFLEHSLKKIAACPTVLDVGGATPFQKDLAPYKGWFSNCEYKTLDINAEYHPDIVGNIEAIPVADETIDGVICKAVLEHVQNPFLACGEIYRILKPGGHAFFWVPFLYPYHPAPGVYGDYWRYTEDGIRHLLKDFSKVDVLRSKHYFETLLDLSPLPTFLRNGLSPCFRLVDRLIPIRAQASGFYAFASK
jgi:SAM-dependent methyltransferase